LLKGFFSHREYENIKNTHLTKQQQTFFRYWTCKEAYLKATGDGLVKLEETEINLTSDLISDQKSELLVTGNWTLKELRTADNFASAVVVNASSVNWQFWDLG
jgi:4'-phosphopantetheinyl transferase